MSIIDINDLSVETAKSKYDLITKLCWNLLKSNTPLTNDDENEINSLLMNSEVNKHPYIRHSLYELKFLSKILFEEDRDKLIEIIRGLINDVFNCYCVSSAYILIGLIEIKLGSFEFGCYHIMRANANYNKNNVVTPFFSYSRAVCLPDMLLFGVDFYPYKYKYFEQKISNDKSLENVLLVSGNKEYLLKYLPNYCKSVKQRQNNPLLFHIHFVFDENIEFKDLEIIKQILENYGIDYEISYTLIPYFWNDKRTFYACSRYLFAAQILSKYKNGILITDLDYQLTEDCTNFYNIIKEYDVAFKVQNNCASILPWLKVMCGTIYVNSTTNGLFILKCFSRAFSFSFNPINFNWGLDQNIWGGIYYLAKKMNISHYEIKKDCFTVPYDIKNQHN